MISLAGHSLSIYSANSRLQSKKMMFFLEWYVEDYKIKEVMRFEQNKSIRVNSIFSIEYRVCILCIYHSLLFVVANQPFLITKCALNFDQP